MVKGLRLGKGLQPFSRDLLFQSLYESCKHRSTALQDASSLAATVIGNVLQHHAQNGIIERQHIVAVAHHLLTKFDQTAAGVYLAYHPLDRPSVS